MPDPEVPDPQEEEKQKRNVWAQIGRYSHMGFILPAAVTVGLVIGGALDRHFSTTWIKLVGLLVGAVAGFMELIRLAMAASREK